MRAVYRDTASGFPAASAVRRNGSRAWASSSCDAQPGGEADAGDRPGERLGLLHG